MLMMVLGQQLIQILYMLLQLHCLIIIVISSSSSLNSSRVDKRLEMGLCGDDSVGW